MNAMIDVCCYKCQRRFGWAGCYEDRPSCPRCGFRPPQEELEAIDRKWDEDAKRRATDPLCATGDVIRLQRVDAGLTLRQAAAKLQVGAAVLSSWEQVLARVPESYAKAMIDLYGLEPKHA